MTSIPGGSTSLIGSQQGTDKGDDNYTVSATVNAGLATDGTVASSETHNNSDRGQEQVDESDKGLSALNETLPDGTLITASDNFKELRLMDIDPYRQLVEDALFERALKSGGSCFTWNEAGSQLLKSSEAVLPEIEAALQKFVFPAFEYSSAGTGAPLGLTYLIGAYLVVGTRSDAPRVFSFFRSMPAALRAEAISVIAVLFGKPKGSEYYIFAPPESLLEFLRAVASGPEGPERGAASQALAKVADSLAGSR